MASTIQGPTTDRRTAANRRNALKSTGPRTPKGKAVSRLNALKHGILSLETLITGESNSDLLAFEKRMRKDLTPVGELELFLVDRIISTLWRIRRCVRIETSVLERQYVMKLERHLDESNAWAATAATELEGGVTWEKLMRYETSLERSLYRNLHELQRRQVNRLGRPVSLPMALDVDLAGGDG